MLILPLAFSSNRSVGIQSLNTVSYGSCRVNSSSDGVTRNVCSRQCLTRGMGGRPSSIIFLYAAGRFMGRE